MSCHTLPVSSLTEAELHRCDPSRDSASAGDRAVARAMVRSEAQQAAREVNAATARLAAALLAMKRDGGWKQDFPSFSEYLAEELQLSPRAAAELIRVAERLEKAQIPLTAGSEVGFHKLTLVHKQVTAENKDALLRDTHELAASALKQRYQPPRPAHASSPAPVASSNIAEVATPVQQSAERATFEYEGNDALLIAALLRARQITGSMNPSENLDFIASEFLRTHPAPAMPSSSAGQSPAESSPSAYRPNGGTLSSQARHVLGGKGTPQIGSATQNQRGRR